VSSRETSVGANTTKLQSKKHSCDLEVSVSLMRIPVKQPKRAAQSKATVELSSERIIEVAKRKQSSDEPAKSPAKAPKSATFNSERNVAVKTSRNQNRSPFEDTRPFAQAAMWRRRRQLAEAEEAKAAALAASIRHREASVYKQNVGGENREASPSAELPTLDERIAAILGEAPPNKRNSPPRSSSKPSIPSLLDVVIPPLTSKRLPPPPQSSSAAYVTSFPWTLRRIARSLVQPVALETADPDSQWVRVPAQWIVGMDLAGALVPSTCRSSIVRDPSQGAYGFADFHGAAVGSESVHTESPSRVYGVGEVHMDDRNKARETTTTQ
jgi:hypothetical protein